jgi:2-dehydro-3-deoxygluconokinase
MTKTLLSIGECLVELAAVGNNLFRQGFAGDTFNTAWYARRALAPSWDVQYFTALGDDPVSTRMLEFMAKGGIGTAHIARRKARAPGLYMIDLQDGERSFTYWREASAAKTLADDVEALRRAVGEADAIYFSGITLAILNPAARTRLLAALADARSKGKLVAFDSNIRLRLWPDVADLRASIDAACTVASLGLPTIPDEAEVFGEKDAAAVARRYRAAGVEEIVVKAGGDAALVVAGTSETLVAPEKVQTIVDTTGAGDSFNGAYIASRLQGETPEIAARKAHARAAKVIQSYGALVE